MLDHVKWRGAAAQGQGAWVTSHYGCAMACSPAGNRHCIHLIPPNRNVRLTRLLKYPSLNLDRPVLCNRLLLNTTIRLHRYGTVTRGAPRTKSFSHTFPPALPVSFAIQYNIRRRHAVSIAPMSAINKSSD
jgi:hypothetical protein